MSKWYEVKMVTVQIIMVETEGLYGEEERGKEAIEAANEFVPWEGDTEFEVSEIGHTHLESHIRHATHVVRL